MSGVYHLLSPEGEVRIVLQGIDHSAIFVLIVGTMTPIHPANDVDRKYKALYFV